MEVMLDRVAIQPGIKSFAAIILTAKAQRSLFSLSTDFLTA
jgi:hypothetical protein